VIRQAISCDICGRDKQQTNHWFVVYEHGRELRISGWSSQVRMSPKAKHLCGQTCLHKLVDDFMARTIAVRAASAQNDSETDQPRPAAASATDTSLTSSAVPASLVPRHLLVPDSYQDDLESARLIPVESRSPRPNDALPPPARPAYGTRAWRVEAWKREQEREKRNARSESTSRRRSIA
jgi:hypothetical protein